MPRALSNFRVGAALRATVWRNLRRVVANVKNGYYGLTRLRRNGIAIFKAQQRRRSGASTPSPS